MLSSGGHSKCFQAAKGSESRQNNKKKKVVLHTDLSLFYESGDQKFSIKKKLKSYYCQS